MFTTESFINAPIIFAMSISLSTCNNLGTREWILTKFDTVALN